MHRGGCILQIDIFNNHSGMTYRDPQHRDVQNLANEVERCGNIYKYVSGTFSQTVKANERWIIYFSCILMFVVSFLGAQA